MGTTTYFIEQHGGCVEGVTPPLFFLALCCFKNVSLHACAAMTAVTGISGNYY